MLLAVLATGCAQTPTRPAPERQAIPDASTGRETPQAVLHALPLNPQAPLGAPVEDIPLDQIVPGSSVTVETSSGTDTRPRALTIRLKDQRFIYREAGQVTRVGPISSGREGYETPRGQFAVLSKERDKVSSRYTNQLGWNAWMPYSIQFNGHYFLHEGWLPGHPDSHGCVRVGEQDARFLFENLKVGDPVSVVD
jgi:lipoprotein-anchoring transpeptidase ErfK/SrfK